jgi:hypothetical protein
VYNVEGDKLRHWYREYISDLREWEKENIYPYVLYRKNIAPYPSIDETCLSQGGLYTIVTNGERHSRKGTLVAKIHGTKLENKS